MFKIVQRSGQIANLLRVTTSVGSSGAVPIVSPVPHEESNLYPTKPNNMTAYTASCANYMQRMSVVSGPNATFSVRFNHTDVQTPDFTDYRRNSTKNPEQKASETEASRKLFVSVAVGVASAATAYSAKGVITKLISSMAPAADVLALATIEVKKSEIPEGKNVTFKWRGKPLFVRHRTAEEIRIEEATDVSSLRDPQKDSERVKDPKFLVVIGVCTHLGCVPIANQGEWNGYYCPCHGSHYDASGRIRKGPAPLNLEVPPYKFVGDVIVVG